MKKLLLIDGSSFLYRAYYGMRPLHAPNGEPVQAVYGFCRMIKKLIKQFNSEHMVLVWDSKGKTLRHEMYADYKATRQAPPSDLFEQKKYIRKFAELIDLAQVEQSGVEADDSIYSLAKNFSAKEFSAKDYEVLVITSDKDLYQLINDKVQVFDPFKDKIVTAQAFEEERGFPVSKLSFYHSLLGDASDNIPGVKGIGKKGAEELVKNFDSLEDLYARLDEVPKERIKNALIANKDNAFLSEKLFLLQYIEQSVTEKDIIFDVNNWKNARPLFEELNFKTLVKEIGGSGDDSSNSSGGELLAKKYSFKCVTTEDELQKVIKAIQAKGYCALDTETDGLDPLQSALIGLSLCYEEGVSFYIPIGHKQPHPEQDPPEQDPPEQDPPEQDPPEQDTLAVDEKQLPKEYVIEQLSSLFADKSIKKVLHNAKFDALVLYSAGLPLQGIFFDTVIAASLVTPDWQRIGLKALSQHYFDERMLTFAEVVKAQKLENFSYVMLDLATEYAAADAHQTFKLWQVLKKELEEKQLMDLYNKVEHPLIDVLIAMEIEGISCDVAVLKHLDEHVSKSLHVLEQEIHALTGTLPGTLNLNSPKQLERLLFYDLGLPTQKKSAKRTGYSTDHEVLTVLAELHIVPRLIVRYRELYKLKSTYISALPESINKKTKKIHTSFNQTNVATGRLASSNPNLQNIPVQDDEVTVRSAFYAREGYTFISADYSQIELRVLAQLSQDSSLKDAFLHDRDIHTQTAAKLFDVSLESVTSQQRQIGKRINFSIMYGQTPYGLSKELKISMGDAKKYIDKYFEQYPGVKKWMDDVVASTKDIGATQTLYGRKRQVPGIYEKNKNLFDAARRIAINTPAQGTAAEVMKLGMIELHHRLKDAQFDAFIVLQIHDELIIEAPESEREKVCSLVKSVLENIVVWEIPLRVSIRSGKNWHDVTK